MKCQPSQPTPDPPQYRNCVARQHATSPLTFDSSVVTLCTPTGATAEQSELYFSNEVYQSAAYDSHNKIIIYS